MADTKARYAIPIGAGTFAVFSGLKGIYTDLKSLLGLKDDAAGLGVKIEGVSVSNFPGVARIRVRYLFEGTDSNPTKFKYGTCICAPANVEDALKGLTGKNFKGKKISEAYLARRRLLY